MKIAVVLTTFNRIEDYKLVVDYYKDIHQLRLESKIDIYHVYNGDPKQYKKYREFHLSILPTLPHREGAVNLINRGIKDVLSSKIHYDAIIVSSGDVLITNSKILRKYIERVAINKFDIVVSIWLLTGFSTEFFVISEKLARKMFPLKYRRMINKVSLLKFVSLKIKAIGLVENFFTYKLLQCHPKISFFSERFGVGFTNRFVSKGFYNSSHRKNIKVLRSELKKKLK